MSSFLSPGIDMLLNLRYLRHLRIRSSFVLPSIDIPSLNALESMFRRLVDLPSCTGGGLVHTAVAANLSIWIIAKRH